MSPSSSRRYIAPLVVAAAVAGGGVAGAALGVPGLSGAQETETTPPTEVPEDLPAPPEGGPAEGRMRDGGGIQAAAEALGLSVEDLLAELRDGKTIATVAQEKGVDVNTVIDAMVAAAVEAGRDEAEARERVTRLVNEGGGIGGPGGHIRGGHGPGVQLDAAAEALGVELDALVEELRNGKTIAQVAEEKGVDVNTVIDAMVEADRERITSFVNEGGPRRGDDVPAPETETETDTPDENESSALVS